ncbi:hypothetical protein [Crinalium epipsammum]|nr:hypothetical protein [Crinalium epipsammum]
MKIKFFIFVALATITLSAPLVDKAVAQSEVVTIDSNYTLAQNPQNVNEQEASEDDFLLKAVTSLIVPLLLLSGLFLLLNKTSQRQNDIVKKSIEVAEANTEAIKENNRLLIEAIKLQEQNNTLLSQLVSK